MDFSKLTTEQQLVILCSRTDITETVKVEIVHLLESGINVEMFIFAAFKNKVLPFAGKNLIQNDKQNKIHFQFKRLIDLIYGAHKDRNQISINVFRELAREFSKNKIKCVPLKGILLAPLTYKDLGVRTLGDIDFLISREDRLQIPSIMKNLGFIQGHIDYSTGSIVRADEREINEWRDTDGNLYPFVRKENDTTLPCVRIDFSFDADKRRNYSTTKGLLENAFQSTILDVMTWQLNPIDFLIHISIHLYKEATNIEWLEYFTDLNLIKFCDVREFTMSNLHLIDWDKLIERSKDLEAEKALFYSFYYVKYIFEDNFCDEVLNRLHHIDESIVNQYGELDYQCAKFWKNDFETRLFNLSNESELS